MTNQVANIIVSAAAVLEQDDHSLVVRNQDGKIAAYIIAGEVAVYDEMASFGANEFGYYAAA